MIQKIILLGLVILSISATAYSQPSFDSIKICHGNGLLKTVRIGEYTVKIENGQLSSFMSKDDAFNYEATSKMLVLRNLAKKSYINLQLSNQGIVLKNQDTSFLLNSLKSTQFSSNDGNEKDILYSFGAFSFLLEFTNGRLSKMAVPATGKYLVIIPIQIQGVYSWDFSIESSDHKNKVALLYSFNKPYLLSIADNPNGVGIRLLAKQKNGVFSELIGQRVFDNGSFFSDNSYRLQYSSHGKLRKKTPKVKLECEQ